MTEGERKLLQYLKSQNLMTLATYGAHPWICSVYYVVDDTFNLYFLSDPDSKHCTDISQNNQIACNIADSRQKVIEQKMGVQIQGVAERLDNLSQIKWVLAVWNKLNPGFEAIINLTNIRKKVIKSVVYKVRPTVIKFLNESLYGPEGFKIFTFE